MDCPPAHAFVHCITSGET
uniref:Uncharacterized protein n=1 Tax=Arundo donax TaxID=35708 RepID=A0A0A9GXM0_ARUDO